MFLVKLGLLDPKDLRVVLVCRVFKARPAQLVFLVSMGNAVLKVLRDLVETLVEMALTALQVFLVQLVTVGLLAPLASRVFLVNLVSVVHLALTVSRVPVV